MTSSDTVRGPMKKPVDHLKPEGEIEFIDKKPYVPAEKVVATKPQDNLFVSGEFNGKSTKKCVWILFAISRAYTEYLI